MAETESTGTDMAAPARKRGRTWMIAAPVLLLLGAGGFAATYAGPFARSPEAGAANHEPVPHAPGFLELDPLTITVGGAGGVRQLRFRGVLELGGASAGVGPLMPRILDVMAGYLRALPLSTLEDPTALLRIRSQLLRRVQLLCGPEAVADLLILDFVIA